MRGGKRNALIKRSRRRMIEKKSRKEEFKISKFNESKSRI